MNIKLKIFLFSILISASNLSFADDTDGDGTVDNGDNCPSIANADQLDTDSDGVGNECDDDDDGDGVLDSLDAFPLIFVSAENDLDRDGKPFECDVFCEYNTGMTQDEDDGPDDEDSAAELSSGSKIAGRIDGITDKDHFFIEVDQPTFITLDLVCNGGYTVEANMKLANNLGFGGGNAYCYQSSWWAEPGRHFLRLEYQQGQSIQDYQLKITLGHVSADFSAAYATLIFPQTILPQLDCSDECSLKLPSGRSEVTFFAKPDFGFGIQEWTGACTGYSQGCTAILEEGFSLGVIAAPHVVDKVPADYAMQMFSVSTLCMLTDVGLGCNPDERNQGAESIPYLENVTQFSGNAYEMCAIDDNGLNCWGRLLGDSPRPSIEAPTLLASSGFGTCIWHAEGLSCWGETTQSSVIPELIAPTGLYGGDNYFCAWDQGEIKCWGSGSQALGDAPTALSEVISFAGGKEHACVVDVKEVVCWGDNELGQLDVPELKNPTQIVAGDLHTCAIDDTGVVCWGSNLRNQLDVPALVNPQLIASTLSTTCAVTQAGVICWGGNGITPPLIPGLSGLDIRLDDFDEDVPNNIEDALLIGGNQVLVSTLVSSDDTDFFRIELAAPNWLTIYSDTLNRGFRLYRDGVEVWSAVNGYVIFSDLVESGDYVLEVFSLYDQTGRYEVEVSTGHIDLSLKAVGGSIVSVSGGWSNVVRAYDFESGEEFSQFTCSGECRFMVGKGSRHKFVPEAEVGNGFLMWTSSCGELRACDGRYYEDQAVEAIFASHTMDLPPLAYKLSGSCALNDLGLDCFGKTQGWSKNKALVPPPLLNPSDFSISEIGCAIDDTGIKCWGDNWTEDLLPNIDNPESIIVSSQAACAIDVNDAITCWPVGRGGLWTAQQLNQFSPQVDSPHEMAIGFYHACVLDRHGTPHCWGDLRGDNTVPSLVFERLRSFWLSTCGLSEGKIYCWGELPAQDSHLQLLMSQSDVIDFDVTLGSACVLKQDGLYCSKFSDTDWSHVPFERARLVEIDFLGNKVCVLDAFQGLACLDDNDLALWSDATIGAQRLSKLSFALTVDHDQDEVVDFYDADDDNDGVADSSDAFPLNSSESVDTDSDGIGNNADTDDDNDGVADSDDAFPFDSAESSDSDGDGLGDNADAFPNDSSETVDSDSDGVGDNADVFPNDSTESADTDLDGVGDNADVFPNDASETLDSDSDGTGDNADAFPNNALYKADSDSDGMPDVWETRYGLDPNDPSDATSDQDNDGVTALDEFLAGTIPSGSLDIDGNKNYDALTDGLLLLRGMFGLDGSALVTGTIASDAAFTESVDIESRIATLGDLADIDGNGEIDALTDGLLTLRYLFGLQGDTLINGVVASDATRKTSEEIEAHLETLMPAL